MSFRDEVPPSRVWFGRCSTPSKADIFSQAPVSSMPASEISDLHSADVLFHCVPAGTFCPSATKTDPLADVCHLLPLQSLIKLLAHMALQEKAIVQHHE